VFLKLPVPVEKMEDFKLSLRNLYSKRNTAQDEEYHKGENWNFLRKIFEPDYSVQVNRPIDLAIFNGNTASAKPAVIIEAKSPTNAAEMFSAEHPNVKSLQELVYYFMLEYVHSGNHEIKWLAITNFDEWYFFDVKDFIRYFGNKSKPIYDQFLKFKANQMSGNKTSDFYNEIAKPAIDDFLASCDINVVHFSLDVIASGTKQSPPAYHPEQHSKQSNAVCQGKRSNAETIDNVIPATEPESSFFAIMHSYIGYIQCMKVCWKKNTFVDILLLKV
jgi:hypothetical protein